MASPLPGKFGNITFNYEVISNSFSTKYNYSVTPKTQGFPTVQSHGDPLIRADLKLRLSYQYNIAPNTPIAVLRQLLNLGDEGNDEYRKNGASFSFANFNWGNFVITDLSWTFTELVDTGQAASIDVDLKLLQVN